MPQNVDLEIRVIKKIIQIRNRIIIYFFLLVILCFQFSCIAMGFKDKIELERSWKTDSYKIKLYHVHGWSGSPFYEYKLYKRGLFRKQLGVGYAGQRENIKDTCIITFSPDVNDTTYSYIFDTCKIQVKEYSLTK
jgi:hypothetical protein